MDKQTNKQTRLQYFKSSFLKGEDNHILTQAQVMLMTKYISSSNILGSTLRGNNSTQSQDTL